MSNYSDLYIAIFIIFGIGILGYFMSSKPIDKPLFYFKGDEYLKGGSVKYNRMWGFILLAIIIVLGFSYI
jgi:hypothetical protein